MTPPSERKAKERQAKRDAGLVRVEAWVRREHVQAVKSYAERLANGTLVYLSPHAGTFDAGSVIIVNIDGEKQ